MLNFIENFLLVALSCTLCLCLCQAYDLAPGERVIQTLEDHVDAENFTFYRLQRDGELKLILHSLEGDVDIFASSEVQHPYFDNYELKSETCGLDILTIPNAMPRPVFIGVYGHPNYLHSRFSLTILSIPKPHIVTYEDLVAQYERYFFDEKANIDGYGEKERNRQSSYDSERSRFHADDELPLWSQILLKFLEFCLEILF